VAWPLFEMSSTSGKKSVELSLSKFVDEAGVDNGPENLFDSRPEQLREASAADCSFLSSRPAAGGVLNLTSGNKQRLRRSPAVDALDDLLGPSSKKVCLSPSNVSVASDNYTSSNSEELFSSTMVQGGNSKKMKMVDLSVIEARESLDPRLSCQPVRKTKSPLSSSQARVTKDFNSINELDIDNGNNVEIDLNENAKKKINYEVDVENDSNKVFQDEAIKQIHNEVNNSSNALKPEQFVGGCTDIIPKSMTMVSESGQSEEDINLAQSQQQNDEADVIVSIGNDLIELSGEKQIPLVEVSGDEKNEGSGLTDAKEASGKFSTKFIDEVYRGTRFMNMCDFEDTNSEIFANNLEVHNPVVPFKEITYVPSSLRGKKITRKLRITHPTRVPASNTFNIFTPREYYKGKPRSVRLFDEFIEEKDVGPPDSLFD